MSATDDTMVAGHEPAGGRDLQAVLPVYRGPFRKEQAERLLWRAGFGPRRGEAKALARLGLDRAVRSLLYPKRAELVGPKPKDDKGRPLAPLDAWGHDQLWWLDKMVRTTRPLVERMTLVWHDWFATTRADVDSAKLMLGQNELFRSHALGSFRQLLLDVTKDPAMLLFLSGANSTKDAPNENYGRELMELFTLGAYRGYGEEDVREQARALTGWAADWKDGPGWVDFRFEPSQHDKRAKTIFGRSGTFDWRDACRLCLENAYHPSFFVTKLWSYFVPTPPDAATQRALERRYRRSGFQVRPVLDGILRHPALYEGERMVKPPAVYTAGMLRALGRGIDTESWAWISSLSGQSLFYPPNVAGWKDDSWIDTSTFRGRWFAANEALSPYAIDPEKAAEAKPAPPTDPAELLRRALSFWGSPTLTPASRAALLEYATQAIGDAGEEWERRYFPPLIENALRQLIAVSPDLQTS